MLIDLHVHSKHTPGCTLTLADLVSAARQRGLDGLCLTDIHSLGGLEEARQVNAAGDFTVLVGFEAMTDRGHYLVFVPEVEQATDLKSWLSFDAGDHLAFAALRRAVEERGGVLIAAHPYDRTIAGSPGDALVQMTGIDAIEVNNANRPILSNDLAEEVAVGLGLPGVGGSDTRNNVDQLGTVASLVRGVIRTEADLIESIKGYDIWPVAIGRPPRARATRPERKQSDRRGPRKPPERSGQGRSRSRGDRDGRSGGRERRRGKPPRE